MNPRFLHFFTLWIQVKEKLANLVMFDKATYDKMLKEIPKATGLTP